MASSGSEACAICTVSASTPMHDSCSSAVIKSAADHLLSHGYTLCDTDGLPTTWAHFGPDELNLDDTWCWEKGINSLELLTFLRIAYHVTGEARYLQKQEE